MEQKTIFIIITFFILTISFSACNKNKEDNLPKVGTYVEVSPTKGYTKINFIDKERLIIMRGEDYESCIEYKYEIHSKTIKLTLVEYPTSKGELYFRMINKNKFEIGYLYGYIPEEYPGNMTFKKE